MNLVDEHYLAFSLVDQPFDHVAPAVIGAARAIWGPVAVHQDDRRRSHEIRDSQIGRLKDIRLALPNFGLSIFGTCDGMTLIENFQNEAIARAISVVLPQAQVLGIESWTEGKVRVRQRMVVYVGGRIVRSIGSEKGTVARGWTWEEQGSPTRWEDPQALAARHISARVTRAELLAITRRFGIDVEATLAHQSNHALAIEFLSLYDPMAPDVVSDDHFELTRRVVALGVGDPLNLEPPDFAGAAELVAEAKALPS